MPCNTSKLHFYILVLAHRLWKWNRESTLKENATALRKQQQLYRFGRYVPLNKYLTRRGLPWLLRRTVTASETELASGHSLILKHNIGNSCIFMNRDNAESPQHVCLTFALLGLEIC